ncbi:hypothetical protein [Mesonia aquimarina]|uniref:hypothetical protein n=1 Tax=Mesonia aquimarina TaxID=1504967 RepID=UPI000EF5943F|nr:hypothetical protein [Mesonia aquimarina]
MNKFYFFFCLFSPIYLFGQETFFSGKIYADSINTTQINIVNLSQEIGSVNKIDGVFSIAANAGDEVIFSSVQYQPYQLTITKEMLEKENKIFLFLEVNQLKEVKLSNIDLTGDLALDAKNMNVYVFDPRSVGLPMAAPSRTLAERRLYTARTAGPLGLLINALSGRLAMLKRMQEYEKLEALIYKAKNMVSEKFLKIDLEIPDNYIDDFLYFCAKDKSFTSLVVKANELNFIAFLTTKKEPYFTYKDW